MSKKPKPVIELTKESTWEIIGSLVYSAIKDQDEAFFEEELGRVCLEYVTEVMKISPQELKEIVKRISYGFGTSLKENICNELGINDEAEENVEESIRKDAAKLNVKQLCLKYGWSYNKMYAFCNRRDIPLITKEVSLFRCIETGEVKTGGEWRALGYRANEVAGGGKKTSKGLHFERIKNN